jgi:ADP-ribose pyrophosphatase YjhB (NUDIX family)
MIRKRRRSAALVKTQKGILIVAWKDKNRGFMIPGGGAKFLETRKRAAIRELEEETGLKAKSAKYLFKFIGPIFKNKEGKLQRNHSKVFLIEAEGKPRPKNEVKHIAYWTPKSKIKLMKGAQMLLDIYKKRYEID